MEVEEDVPVDVSKIRCLDMPDEFLKKSVARQFFEQFGEVQHIIIKPKSKICYVHYKTYEDAQRALFNANYYQGKKLNISKYSSRPKTRQAKKDNDPIWLPDREVQEELAAMASINERSVYNLRQEAMLVDSPPRPSSAATKKTKRIEKPTSKNGWTPEQLELLSTIKQVTHTIEDKYKVLEARDKLMRLRLKKLTNMDKATKGTCPDMCPEKERLQREIQHQVALYEQDAVGKCMNPYLAIKQYSRSSADQEAPLPHELRPVATLELSMGYLTHNIMNLCDVEDVNLAEWYHFLWDRTRSIRKDITQQELCCHGSVALLEQCARFHIHCSARLVAEDPSVFDQKINTENLTKCLQTLKYMYHDLELKGESCKNEAEFRAYIILLNLNDGNFMWEVQQLKLNIQKSPEVKFALEVYSALDKNNFVKFFKLVRSTNYLNACILLRYFIQVRGTALSTILKCYSPRTPYTQFPLSELQHLLAFEDASSLTEFLASFGLYLNQDESQVILDRKAHQEPEIPITLDRAVNVVESKRTKSVGEVVCGGVLPPPLYKSYVPRNSFAENGVLIMTDTLKEIIKEAQIPSEILEQPKVTAVDQPDGEKLNQPLPFWAFKNESIFKTKADSPPRLGIFGGTKPSEAAKQFTFKMPQSATAQQKSLGIFPLPSNDNQFASTVVQPQPQKPVFNVPIFPTQKNQNESIMQSFFGSDAASKPKTALPQAPAHFSGSQPPIFANQKFDFGAPLVQTARPASEKVETNMAEVLRLKEEETKRRLMERAAEEQRERERLEKLRLEELARMKEEALRKENERRKREKEEEMEKRRIAMLVEKERLLRIEINKTVTELMNDLLARVEAIRKEERLNDIATNIRNFKTRQFVALWKKKCRLIKRKRHAIDQNPVWLPERSVSEEAAQLLTANQELMLQNIKRYKTGKSYEIAASEREQVDSIDISYYYKLLLASYTKMQTRLPNELFWKVTVSLPDFKEVKVGLSVIESVLMQYFKWKDRYGSTARVDQYQSGKLLGYCIERKQGVLEVDSNSNGIVFLSHEPSDHLHQRISFAIKNFPKCCRLAVAVVFVNDEAQSINSQKLGVLLEKNPRITNYKVITCQFQRHSILSAVKESLDFLSENIQKPPPLELDMVGSFVYSHLSIDLWNRMKSCSVWNANYKTCLKSPNLVIGLYNQGIDKLKEIVSDHTCLDYPSFPIEFDVLLHEKIPEVLPCDYRSFPSFWRKATYRSLLRKTLNSLKLPEYKSVWPPNDESTLEKDLFAYCLSIFKNPQKVFYKVMAVVLKNYDPSCDFDRIKNLLWIDIMGVISAEKLQEGNFLLRHTPFHAKSTFTQSFVVYKTQALERFKSEEWFYLENPLVKSEIKKLPEKVYAHDVRRTNQNTISVEEIDLDEIEKMVRADKTVSTDSNIDKLRELEEFMKDLETSMDIHKQINATFQRTVNQALGINN
ncbi:hypothetical protein PPYR_12985 [Photinus pyralis]|uniref:Germinal-center associated nuclear protein n=1 Tax=Photinus pyralis TaxID=7054 RepID=A0A1Y1JT76_PHOPY|nr:protein xmas-2 isoform X2 [Photinus pyralis]KAB0793365.1 hypothetical protein PPYR_12985 [Photinus pyralis]